MPGWTLGGGACRLACRQELVESREWESNTVRLGGALTDSRFSSICCSGSRSCRVQGPWYGGALALPHPPPSLHILPPTPELQRAHQPPPTHLSISVPRLKPVELSLSFPERSSSEEVSPLTLGSTDSDIIDQSLSDLTSDKHSPLSPSIHPLPLVLPTVPNSDDNNNPSELQIGSALDSRGDADGSSNHSADSIDFFSAREKFLGLAQDGRSRTLSEQAQQRTPLSLEEDEEEIDAKEEEEEENGMSQSEDGIDKATPDRTHHPHHDNGVSVRHIVTEIEAICHPASCPPTLSSSSSSSSSLPLSSSHSPQLIRPEHPLEAETPEVAHGSLTPPSHPQSPSMLPRDWPAGSVRRATKQLEQKLRQEMEMAASQRSPLHSPSAEHPPVRLSVCPLGTEHPPIRFPQNSTERITQGEITAVSAKSKDGEKHTGSQTELQRINSSGIDNLPDPSCSPNSNISQVSGAIPTTDSHMLTSSLASTSQLEESSLDTSAQAQKQSQLHSQNQQCHSLPQACSNQMTLDGVTVKESDTDERLESSSQDGRVGCGPGCDAQSRLARGSQELERIQQTLRELQAFLHEGVGLETTDIQDQELGQPQSLKDAMDTELGPSKVASSEQTPPGLEGAQRLRERQEGKSFLEPAGWHRAMELEARIRQAGLTPPSLMKRSASLAKLDCLELSANDLSDLDLRPHTRSTSSHSFSTSPCHPDDTWKKQKVLARNACIEKTGLSHGGGDVDELSSSSSSSSPSLCFSSAPHCHQRDDTREREEPDGGGNGAVTTTRQQGRGHSSRRSRRASAEKKQRAVTVLYNTM